VLGRASDQRKRRSEALLPSAGRVRLSPAADGRLRLLVGKSWGSLRVLRRGQRARERIAASESKLDAVPGGRVLADDARREDPQQHVDAMAGPLTDLGGRNAGIEPGRDGGVP